MGICLGKNTKFAIEHVEEGHDYVKQRDWEYPRADWRPPDGQSFRFQTTQEEEEGKDEGIVVVKKGIRGAKVVGKARAELEADLDKVDKDRKVREEMEQLRRKLRVAQDDASGKVEEKKENANDDEEIQRNLKLKKEQIRMEEERRQKRRDEENAKIKQMEAENAKKREEQRLALKAKIESGEAISLFEKKLAEEWFENVNSSKPSESTEMHPSQISDRPKNVSKLNMDSSVVKLVQGILEKKTETHFELQEDLSSFEAILDSTNSSTADSLEVNLSNLNFFKQFTTPEGYQAELQSKKADAISKLTDSICNNEKLELLEMYSSGLDDSFLAEFSTKIKQGNMKSIQEIHLESNLFTGKGLVLLLDALCDGEIVPNLNSVKLANQKSVDSISETAAIKLLRSNPRINRLTFDFTKPIDMAEANRLLARNGAIAKSKGQSSLSRSAKIESKTKHMSKIDFSGKGESSDESKDDDDQD